MDLITTQQHRPDSLQEALRQHALTALSPHLDDAALSVGGILAANRHEDTQIRTVYTAGPAVESLPRAHVALGDYARRKEEDLCAADVLGVDVQHLDRWEQLWRQPQSLRSVFTTPPSLDGFAGLAAVRRLVDEALDRPGLVLAPLGIGNHVDHMELAVAAMQVAIKRDALDRVLFYEDFYALSERLRRRHSIAGRARRPRTAVAGLRAPAAQVVLSAGARLTRGPSLGHYVPEVAVMPWAPCAVALSAEAEGLKRQAIAAYRSQTELLGPLAGSLDGLLRRHCATLGGEPIWRFAGRTRAQMAAAS